MTHERLLLGRSCCAAERAAAGLSAASGSRREPRHHWFELWRRPVAISRQGSLRCSRTRATAPGRCRRGGTACRQANSMRMRVAYQPVSASTPFRPGWQARGSAAHGLSLPRRSRRSSLPVVEGYPMSIKLRAFAAGLALRVRRWRRPASWNNNAWARATRAEMKTGRLSDHPVADRSRVSVSSPVVKRPSCTYDVDGRNGHANAALPASTFPPTGVTLKPGGEHISCSASIGRCRRVNHFR